MRARLQVRQQMLYRVDPSIDLADRDFAQSRE
jgi:hypothetical protein